MNDTTTTSAPAAPSSDSGSTGTSGTYQSPGAVGSDRGRDGGGRFSSEPKGEDRWERENRVQREKREVIAGAIRAVRSKHDLEEAVAPFADELAKGYGSTSEGMRAILHAGKSLNQDPAAFARWMVETYGISLDQLRAADPRAIHQVMSPEGRLEADARRISQEMKLPLNELNEKQRNAMVDYMVKLMDDGRSTRVAMGIAWERVKQEAKGTSDARVGHRDTKDRRDSIKTALRAHQWSKKTRTW